MGYDAPWNLAGVPRDAMDAARIAARNAGMSVGEWLTRQILDAAPDAPEVSRYADDRDPSADLAARLQALETALTAEPSREAVKKLQDELSKLNNDLVQSAGHSAIQLSSLSAKLENVAYQLGEVRTGSAVTAQALEKRIADIAGDAAQQDRRLTGELERLDGRVGGAHAETVRNAEALTHGLESLARKTSTDTVALSENLDRLRGELEAAREEASGRDTALERRVHRFVDQTASLLTAQLNSLGQGLNETRSGTAESARSLGERLDVLAQASAGRTDELSAGLEALTRGLEQARAEATARNQILEDGLARLTDRSSALETAMSERLKACEATIHALQADGSALSRMIEQRLAQLTDRVTAQEAVQASDARTLGARLDEMGAKSSETLGSLQQQHAHVQKGLEDVQSQLSRTAAEIHAGVDGKLDALRTETTATHETVSAALDRLRADHQAQAAQTAADIHQSVDARLETARAESTAAQDVLRAALERVQSDLHAQSLQLRSAIHDTVGGKIEATEAEQVKTRDILESTLAQLQADLARLDGAQEGFAQTVAEELAQLKAHLGDSRAEGATATDEHAQTLSEIAARAAEREEKLLVMLKQLNDEVSRKREESVATAAALQQGLAQLAAGDRKTTDLSDQLRALGDRVNEIASRAAGEGANGGVMASPDEVGALQISALGGRVQELGGQLDAARSVAADQAAAIHTLTGQLQYLDQQIRSTTTAGADAGAPPADSLGLLRTRLDDIQNETVQAVRSLDGLVRQSNDRSSADLQALKVTVEQLAARLDSLQHDVARGTDLPAVAPPPVPPLPFATPFVEPSGATPPFPPFPTDVSGLDGSGEPFAATVHSDVGGDAALPPFASFVSAETSPGFAEAIAVLNESHPEAVTTGYLSAARQSARMAAQEKAQRDREGGSVTRIFAHGQTPGTQRTRKTTLWLASGIGLLAVAAAGVGLVLNLNASHTITLERGGRVPGALSPDKPARSVSLSAAGNLDAIVARARAGDPDAEVLVGLRYLGDSGGKVDYAEAARWFEQAARKGSPVAQYHLGLLFASGHGMPADPAKAIEWYRSAAQAGHRKAMYNLAVMYFRGTGVAMDMPEAARWLTKAANLGLVDAQFDLAVLYERGSGVPQSLTNAYSWYAIAARNGDKEAKDRRDALATQISVDERAAADDVANRFAALPLDARANEVRR